MAEHRDVEVRGLRLRITEAGVGGRPVLLVHGFTGARTDFEHHIDPLAALGFHVVAPDQRGHGESEQPDDRDAYSWTELAADVLALADVVGWDRFTLLGHSMGGMVAQEVVVRDPRRIGALILMDTSGESLALDPDLRDAGIAVAAERGTGVIADLTAGRPGPLDTAAHLRVVAADPTYAARGERNLRAASGKMYASMLGAISDRTPTYDDLARVVRCPTLVLVGEEDEPFRGPSERLAAAIPGARLVVLPGGGHSPQFECPAAWFDALTGFLTDPG